MQICPNCARERDDRDIVCVYCGYAGTPADTAPPPPIVIPTAPPLTAAPPPGVAVNNEFKPPAPAAAAREAATHRKNTRRNVLLGAVAIGVVGAMTFIMRSAGGEAQRKLAGAAPAPVAAARGAVPVAITESTAPPKWKRTRQSRWATDGSHTMGFELEAEQYVPVYMDRVRPTLAVRCVSRYTEVFVVLYSAASIESAGDTHTVAVSLDGEPDVEQHWLDSDDKQELFAPDGKALAARMAASQRLRFSFKPFNAARATVEFDVHGLDGPLAAMSKTCDPAPNRKPVPRG